MCGTAGGICGMAPLCEHGCLGPLDKRNFHRSRNLETAAIVGVARMSRHFTSKVLHLVSQKWDESTAIE